MDSDGALIVVAAGCVGARPLDRARPVRSEQAEKTDVTSRPATMKDERTRPAAECERRSMGGLLRRCGGPRNRGCECLATLHGPIQGILSNRLIERHAQPRPFDGEQAGV